jgi:predicted dehydrogenase
MEMIEIQQDTLPKLGFLGVGWIGKNRLEALVNHHLIEEIALCDPDSSSIRSILNTIPSAKVHENFMDLLKEDVDGIVIATPSALHAKQAIQALKEGKAVFCQKPLGRNLEETKAVVSMAKQANKLLSVDYSYRYTKGIRAIKKLIDQEKLGKIYAVEAVFHNAYGPDKAWFYDPELSGGGCLIDLGSHLLDLLVYLFNPPTIEVQYAHLLTNGKTITDPRKAVEDFAEAQLNTSTGISIRMACSWKLPVGKDAEISLKIFGTKGGASFHNVNGSFYDFQTDLYYQNSAQTIEVPPDDWGGKAIQHWAEQLAQQNTFNPNNEELVKSAALMEDIYKFNR